MPAKRQAGAAGILFGGHRGRGQSTAGEVVEAAEPAGSGVGGHFRQDAGKAFAGERLGYGLDAHVIRSVETPCDRKGRVVRR